MRFPVRMILIASALTAASEVALAGSLWTAKHIENEARCEVVPIRRPVCGLDKLGPGCCQAANLSISSARYASSGVRPSKVLCGRPAL